MAIREDFTFPSRDERTPIHAVRWLPEDRKYKATVQLVHGMVEYIGRYEPFAEYLTKEGYRVVGHDHVGHGDSVVSDEDLGFVGPKPASTWLLDMHTLRTQSQDGKPYFMLGHSMGSFLLRTYLTKRGGGLKGAVIMGTGMMPKSVVKTAMGVCRTQAAFQGWNHRSKLLQQLSYGKPYKKFSLDGSDLTNTWLTRDAEIAKKYYQDPKCTYIFTCNAYMGMFEAILYSCSEEGIVSLPRELPLFLVSGDDDPVGDLGEGVEKLYDKYRQVGMTDVTMQLYPGDRHEILNELDRDRVYHDILSWMNARI